MSDEKKTITGLSPSSFSEYSACNRKWFLRKVARVPIDPDASEDYSAFNIGKAFHKALEDTGHNLAGFTHVQCVAVCAEFGVAEITVGDFVKIGVYYQVSFICAAP